MRKQLLTAFAIVSLAAGGLALSACHKKQGSPGQQMKQGAQQMGQGMKHATSNAGQAMSDSAITTKIKSKLAANQGLSSFNIHVETNNGMVTLTGTVDMTSKRDLAGRIADSTDGVKGVTNNIKVGQGG
ncbi:MAG: BON domain-containing protein [Gammaproteobacteria bacterium]